MHDFQIRDSDILAGYAFPRGPGLPRSGISASQMENETQDYRGEMNVPGIRTIENIIGKKGGSLFPSEEHRRGGGVWNIITP